MDLKYLSDSEGKHTAVVVPIEEWNNIQHKLKTWHEMEKPRLKLSKFRGSISKETAEKLLVYTSNARKEWDNPIS